MQPRTNQQAAILSVLDELGHPVTPKELLKTASAKSPGLGLATVYRALKRLVKSGEVRKIELVGVPPHYERQRNGHHHFFVCEDCHTLFELNGCPGGFKETLPSGFRMNSHEVIIYGTCRDCAV